MNIYLKEGRIPTEKYDCSVIALSYAFNIDYVKAHEICKKAGRKDRGRFHLRHVLKCEEGKLSITYMSRRVGYHGRPGMSVGKFQQKHPKGTYIVFVSGHVFVIIDGVVFNQQHMKARIKKYYYISSPKIKTI